MKNYLEITLINNPDMSISKLWGKFYIQLHLALVEMQDPQGKVPIGISFPKYRYEPQKGGHLGSKLRIFTKNEAILEQLSLGKWLSGLIDYIHCTSIREVPDNRVIKYAQYRRYHVKGNFEKLARRRAKRHKISLEEAMKCYENEKKENINDLPYIELKSLTTQQTFKLCIEKCDQHKLIQEGFSTYGLSHSSTVPEF